MDKWLRSEILNFDAYFPDDEFNSVLNKFSNAQKEIIDFLMFLDTAVKLDKGCHYDGTKMLEILNPELSDNEMLKKTYKLARPKL